MESISRSMPRIYTEVGGVQKSLSLHTYMLASLVLSPHATSIECILCRLCSLQIVFSAERVNYRMCSL